MNYKKIVLLILDGFGVASKSRGNAVSLANTPKMNSLLANYPAVTLQAAGPLVGLPWGETGNSEVGHLNIGAGRIVGQDLPRITSSIQSGEFFKNETFLKACEHVKKNNSKLHLLGLISSGGVHSSDEHLYALLALAAEQGIANTYIHMITDGRDTDEKAALATLEKLRNKIAEIGAGKIATVTGRFYAMDRAGHWEQTELTYQAMVEGQGEVAVSALECVASNYAKGIYDEMIKPSVIYENDQPVATVSAGDAVIFFNFRQDRAVQLTLAFVEPERMELKQKHNKLDNLFFATMTSYMENLNVEVAFPQLKIENNLAELVSKADLRQFHAAESEKFAHVTSFFNGGKLDPLKGEERVIIQSPADNTSNYADHPEMSVERLTDVLVEKIRNTDCALFVANFANADMVGHTGNILAATKAVEAIDEQVGKIVEAILALHGCLIITADHGNVEQMVNSRTGEINKDHSTSPVPFILVANEFKKPEATKATFDSLASMVPEGSLQDIAPTVLELMGMKQPPEMTGVSLLGVVKTG